MKRLLYPILFLLSVSLVNAQFWKTLNGVYGGTAYEIINHTATGALVTINNGGIFRSTDNGANWTRISSGIVSTDVSMRGLTQDGSGKLYCNSFSRVYSSTDGGLTWTQTTTVTNTFGTVIKVSPANGNIFISNSGANQILRSTDGGQTFNATTFSASNITDMEVNSSGHVIVAVYGQSALYITTNNGTNWLPMSSGSYSGFPALNANHSYEIAIDNSNNLFVLTDTAPYRLASDATAWASIKGTLTETLYYGNIFASGANVFLTNNGVNKLFTYNGSAWDAGVAYPYASMDITAFLPTSSTEFYMGVASLGIYKSTNSGAGWAASSNGMKGFSYSDLYLTSNGRLFATGSSLGYQISLDDGQTWDLNIAGNANRYLLGFVTLSDNSILGFGSGTIRSTDNGNNWTVQNANQFLTQVAVNGTSLFSFSGSNLLKSVDAGVTWTSTAISGLPTPSKIQVDASNNTYFYASNSIYKVNSGATTATLLGGVASVRDFVMVSNTLIAVVSNGTAIAKSVDGGTNWTTQTLNSANYASKLWAYNSNVIVTQASISGNTYLSNNGGATWASNPLLDNYATITDVVFRLVGSTDVYAYAAANNSAVHKSVNEIILPAAPTNLQMVTNAYNAIEFIWDDNADNEDQFVIEVSEGGNSSYSNYSTTGRFGLEVGYATNKGFGFINTNANTTYFIRIYAKNGAGGSANSNEISVTTIDQCVSTIPDNRSWTVTTVADSGFTPFGSGPYTNNAVLIKATANNSNLFTVSRYVLGIIDPATGHSDQSMTMGESCGQAFLYSSNDDLNNTNGTWNSTTKTIVIKWRTLPYYDDFQATTTLVMNSTDPIPATPSFSLYTFSSTEVLLNWSQPGFETQYVIQRATVSGGPYTDITVNYPKTSYIDKGLTTGTQYFYRIKALNATGSSAYSAEQSISLTASHLFKPVENSLTLNFENQQGASWGDLDGDGDEDIASPSFINNAGLNVPPVFYENIGDGQFNRRSLSVLENDNDAISRGINIVDFNNDGKLDIYITRSGTNVADLLLINNGNWDFTRTALAATALYSNSFRSAAAVDYDKDGLVDVYVGNESGATPPNNPGFLLKNTSGNAFTVLTNGSLATDLVNPRLSSWADYDNDGDQDIYVINNTSPTSAHRLYKNNGDGTFTRVTGTIFDSDPFTTARTISWGDIDNDGDLDLYVGIQSASTNITFNDRLYRNDGNGVFSSQTTSPVAENATPTYGSSFGDIDNDGDLDLLVINSTANSIFINNGSGVFTKSTSQELFTNPTTFEIGGAMADFDADGFLDIYPAKGSTAAIDLPNFLYKNNGTPSSSKNWIEIKLKGTTSNQAAIGARIKVVTTSPARTQIREISSRTGYGSQNSLIQHFGLGTATSISQIEIKWPSGLIQTINNVTQLNKMMTIVEDLTPPTFTFIPAHNSTNVVVGDKLEVTLSEPATAVAGKNLVIRKESSTAAALQTIAVTSAVIDSNNKATFTLAANLEYLTQYFVSIDAGAFIDAYQNGTLAVAATDWVFTTEEQPDLTPPTIVFDPPATVAKNFPSGTKFELTAADNKGIASVTMFYRKVTEINFKQLPGTFNTGTSKYDFALSNSFFDDMGMEYYFEAKDAKPNTTRSPASGNYLTRISSTEDLLALSISPGTTVASYRIISIPLEMSTTQVGLVFDELGAPDPKAWRLLKYIHTPQSWNENFQNVARGEGYFIISKTAANIGFGTVSSPNNTQSNPFVLNLKQGFNLIGNPYTVPINWGDVKAGISGVGDLKIFQNGSYSTSTADLGVFEGGFVFAGADVSVPVKFKTTTGGRKSGAEIGSDLGNEEWMVSLKLSQGDRVFNFGGIGMSQNASLSYDDLDDMAPPSLFERQEIKFAHPEHFMKNFARDVVPTQNEFDWIFKVDTEIDGAAELTWDNTTFGNNPNELYLLDVSRQLVIDMRAESQYSFDPAKSATFKVYFGQDLKSKVKPEGVFLGHAFPNPSDKLVNIPFTVSGPENYQVRLEVYDMMGKKVTTLVDQELKSGYYSTTWDVEQTSSANGLYTCRLLVHADGKNETYTNKVIVNK